MTEKAQAPPFEMAVPVVSHSHRMTPDALAALTSGESYVWFSDVSEFALFLRVRNHFGMASREDFIQFGHYSLSMLLIALNVSTCNHFTWAVNARCPYPQYSLADRSTADPVTSVSVHHDIRFPEEEIRDITADDLQRAQLLFLALAKENEPLTIREEYIKGAFHLGHSLVELDFRRDAFGNFYRALEFFITRKVLGATKLKNEVASVAKALGNLGLPDEFVAEYNRLYRLRPEQVMHAQRPQSPLEWEDVVSLKRLLDCVIASVYGSVVEAALKEIESQA